MDDVKKDRHISQVMYSFFNLELLKRHFDFATFNPPWHTKKKSHKKSNVPKNTQTSITHWWNNKIPPNSLIEFILNRFSLLSRKKEKWKFRNIIGRWPLQEIALKPFRDDCYFPVLGWKAEVEWKVSTSVMETLSKVKLHDSWLGTKFEWRW